MMEKYHQVYTLIVEKHKNIQEKLTNTQKILAFEFTFTLFDKIKFKNCI